MSGPSQHSQVPLQPYEPQGQYQPQQQYIPPQQPVQQNMRPAPLPPRDGQNQQQSQEIPQQQQQQQVILTAPAPSFSMQCSNPVDPRFPKSAEIFKSMYAIFGPNVVPPPDWIATDDGRCHFLQTDQNALMFFKANKSTNIFALSSLWNSTNCCSSCWGCCGCGCCLDKPKVDGPWGVNTEVFAGEACADACLCCCLCDCEVETMIQYMTPNRAKRDDDCAFWFPMCCGLVGARQKFVKRLNGIGISYEENQCQSCLLLWFCYPCTVFQTRIMGEAAAMIRYGPLVTFSTENGDISEYENWLNKQTVQPGMWVKYKRECRENPAHPYHVLKDQDIYNKEDFNFFSKNVKYKLEMGIETVIDPKLKKRRAKIFADWKDRKAIQNHNSYWDKVHQIVGVEMK